jgi:uncharacterized protein
MNVLIDTNVLFSAALRDRMPKRVVLHVAVTDTFRWLVTPQIIAEYTEVLRRPKFGLDEGTVGLLAMRTVTVDSPLTAPDFPRDPKDAPFLAAALAVQADFLITGDKDLLQAKGIIATRIVTVAELAASFRFCNLGHASRESSGGCWPGSNRRKDERPLF